MRLTVNKLTALHIMREMRASGHVLPRAHVGLLPPDPEPRKRWTKTALPLDALRLSAPPDASHKLYVAVPAQSARLKATFASNTVYEAGLPDDSFADVGGGVCIPCPELLFVEMAGVMSPAAHVLLGYELCGTFVRDADDPRAGEVAFGVPPVTSARKIRAYMDECHQVVGVALAERHLAYVEDNAWSPMEAVLATMLALPVEELGYGLGPLKLNVRRNNASELVARGSASSRVPDIELAGKPIGFNYDGKGHLDLDSVLFAEGQDATDAAAAVRKKYVDDLRRNRELMSMGKLVMPVVSEDLFAPGGLDSLVLEAVLAMDAFGMEVSAATRGCIGSVALSPRRQELVWSLLPWSEAASYARLLMERERRATSRAHEVIEIV